MLPTFCDPVQAELQSTVSELKKAREEVQSLRSQLTAAAEEATQLRADLASLTEEASSMERKLNAEVLVWHGKAWLSHAHTATPS